MWGFPVIVNLPSAIVASFIASAVMAVATGFLGVDIMGRLGTTFGSSLYLMGGPMHFGIGIVYGLVYAGIFVRRLRGPLWLRGLQFSILPWLISLAAAVIIPIPRFFHPEMTGTTILSRVVQLMPDWTVGLLAHMVYGTALGWLYNPLRRRI